MEKDLRKIFPTKDESYNNIAIHICIVTRLYIVHVLMSNTL